MKFLLTRNFPIALIDLFTLKTQNGVAIGKKVYYHAAYISCNKVNASDNIFREIFTTFKK